MADTPVKLSPKYFWAFVNNPAKWAIDEFLRSGKTVDEWGINRRTIHENKLFNKGQLAVVRVGRDRRSKAQLKGHPRLSAGIYAVCEILSSVYPNVRGPDQYSYGAAVHPIGWPTVQIRYIRSYLENPLLIEDLRRQAPDLDKRILQGQQISSFRLPESDFTKLLSFLDAHTGDNSGNLEVQSDRAITDTERDALVKARVGQGQYKNELLVRWGVACATSGCTVPGVLRASHMKPWRESTNGERLDSANGLLLAAHLDALFDRNLISFTDDGEMLVASRIDSADRQRLGIPQRLRLPLSDKEKVFLALHRDRFNRLNI